ncbi:hypothetical protein EVAR_71892_1 [Eumeta japonica]|uniref:Uncharacterized protein n=1 Tax=Eumeta variegata TaxID=151549 RepID=A0A4C1SY92_EUMVA|nr:hypothetical protein EVAR_71892_1 [Eumeta japonica]
MRVRCADAAVLEESEVAVASAVQALRDREAVSLPASECGGTQYEVVRSDVLGHLSGEGELERGERVVRVVRVVESILRRHPSMS